MVFSQDGDDIDKMNTPNTRSHLTHHEADYVFKLI